MAYLLHGCKHRPACRSYRAGKSRHSVLVQNQAGNRLKQTANKEGLRGKSVLSLRRVCRTDRKSSELLSTELFSIVCRQKETAAFLFCDSPFVFDRTLWGSKPRGRRTTECCPKRGRPEAGLPGGKSDSLSATSGSTSAKRAMRAVWAKSAMKAYEGEEGDESL